jgi:hypothetical protein
MPPNLQYGALPAAAKIYPDQAQAQSLFMQQEMRQLMTLGNNAKLGQMMQPQPAPGK